LSRTEVGISSGWVVRCGAVTGAVAVVGHGDDYRADVDNDGSPVNRTAWMWPGGRLHRPTARLRRHVLTVELLPQTVWQDRASK
jgi:hypothetical protein